MSCPRLSLQTTPRGRYGPYLQCCIGPLKDEEVIVLLLVVFGVNRAPLLFFFHPSHASCGCCRAACCCCCRPRRPRPPPPRVHALPALRFASFFCHWACPPHCCCRQVLTSRTLALAGSSTILSALRVRFGHLFHYFPCCDSPSVFISHCGNRNSVQHGRLGYRPRPKVAESLLSANSLSHSLALNRSKLFTTDRP
jgi:hypothetical protein